jgi:hypothetical protein
MYPFDSGFLISYVALLYCLVPRTVGELKLAQPVAFRTTFPGHWFPLGSSSDKQFSAFYVWCGRVPVHALVCSITHQNDRLGQGCVARQLKMIWFVWTECTALDRLGLSSCNLLAAAATTQRGCEHGFRSHGALTKGAQRSSSVHDPRHAARIQHCLSNSFQQNREIKYCVSSLAFISGKAKWQRGILPEP